MQTIDKVNKIIQRGENAKLGRPNRNRRTQTDAPKNGLEERYMSAQPRFLGSPKERVQKILKDVWKNTCKDQIRKE